MLIPYVIRLRSYDKCIFYIQCTYIHLNSRFIDTMFLNTFTPRTLFFFRHVSFYMYHARKCQNALKYPFNIHTLNAYLMYVSHVHTYIILFHLWVAFFLNKRGNVFEMCACACVLFSICLFVCIAPGTPGRVWEMIIHKTQNDAIWSVDKIHTHTHAPTWSHSFFCNQCGRNIFDTNGI